MQIKPVPTGMCRTPTRFSRRTSHFNGQCQHRPGEHRQGPTGERRSNQYRYISEFGLGVACASRLSFVTGEWSNYESHSPAYIARSINHYKTLPQPPARQSISSGRIRPPSPAAASPGPARHRGRSCRTRAGLRRVGTRQAGANDYVRKPFNRTEVLAGWAARPPAGKSSAGQRKR